MADPAMLTQPIPVSALSRVLEQEPMRYVRTSISDMRIVGRTLAIANGEERILHLDDEGIDRLGSVFNIPRGYLPKLPPSLIEANLRYWFGEHSESTLLLELDTEGRSLIDVYPGDRDFIPRSRVIEVVQRVMPSDSRVHRLNFSGGRCDIDVATAELTVEPRVGDITQGGLRFAAHVSPRGTNLHPRVSVYMHRLACTNGMTHTIEAGNVYLRGNTVDDIIEEMELAARRLLQDVVPQRLEQFASLDHVRVQNPAQFLHRLAREHRITNSIEVRMLERLPELGDSPTAYDLVNFMNAFQHEDGVRPVQVLRLQELAGVVAAEQAAHRCPQCQSPLE